MTSNRFAFQKCTLRIGLVVFAASLFTEAAASGSTVWQWNYAGPGIAASGNFETRDSPDANGGFLITAIAGMRNGEIITGLQPAGTPIPGNEPFAVDDLIFLGPGPQLTKNGFGFSTSGGNFSNPFFADFLASPGYLEFFSTPPFGNGTPGPGDSELSVQFSATPVPEPATYVLIPVALFLLVWACAGAGKSDNFLSTGQIHSSSGMHSSVASSRSGLC